MTKRTFPKNRAWKASQRASTSSKFSHARNKFRVVQPLRTVERKEVLTYVNSTINEQTPTRIVSLINGVATGTDVTNRIGRKITHNYVEVKAFIQSSATGSSDGGFWAIILDRQSDGTTPAFTDIYDTSVITVGGIAPRNTLVNQDRFRVLAQEDFLTTLSGNDKPYYLSRFIDLRGMKDTDRTVNFNSTGSAASDINQGSIWFVAACCVSLTATPVTVKAGIKYRFTDV